MHNAFANTSITVGSAIKTGKLLQPIMDKMNAWMQTGSAYAGQYIYCDVPDVECGELAFTQDDFWTAYLPAVHPTAAGHRYIADRILSVLPDTALPFEDVPEGAWYAPYVNWALANGIVSGTSATTFSPDAKITRQDMAVMLYQYTQRYDVALQQQTVTPFTDESSISAYALPAVQALHRAGVISGMPDGSFQPFGTATREQACVVLCAL